LVLFDSSVRRPGRLKILSEMSEIFS